MLIVQNIKFPKSIKDVFDIFQQTIDPFFYEKKFTTLKNQVFINYLEKTAELLIAIDSILLMGKSCRK